MMAAQSGALDAVASPFEPKQSRARDLAGERLTVSEWEHSTPLFKGHSRALAHRTGISGEPE